MRSDALCLTIWKRFLLAVLNAWWQGLYRTISLIDCNYKSFLVCENSFPTFSPTFFEQHRVKSGRFVMARGEIKSLPLPIAGSGALQVRRSDSGLVTGPGQRATTTHRTRQIAGKKPEKLCPPCNGSFSVKSDLLVCAAFGFNEAARKRADLRYCRPRAGQRYSTCFQITPLTAQANLVQHLLGHAPASRIALDGHQEQQLAPARFFRLQADAVLFG